MPRANLRSGIFKSVQNLQNLQTIQRGRFVCGDSSLKIHRSFFTNKVNRPRSNLLIRQLNQLNWLHQRVRPLRNSTVSLSAIARLCLNIRMSWMSNWSSATEVHRSTHQLIAVYVDSCASLPTESVAINSNFKFCWRFSFIFPSN